MGEEQLVMEEEQLVMEEAAAGLHYQRPQ